MKQPAKEPRRGGRPRLPPEDRRDDIVEVRLKRQERAEIVQRAKQAGLELSTYMREASLKTRIIGPPSVENLKAYVALKNTMNNLNQAVKAVNSGLNAMDQRVIDDLSNKIDAVARELVRKRR
jgi:uncharacterized membrane protein